MRQFAEHGIPATVSVTTQTVNQECAAVKLRWQRRKFPRPNERSLIESGGLSVEAWDSEQCTSPAGLTLLVAHGFTYNVHD